MTLPVREQLHRPAPAAARLLRPALAWGLAWAALVAGVVFVCGLVLDLLGGQSLNVADALGAALSIGLVLFPALAFVRLMAQSRVIQDRSFTLLGFLATFFGLAMLIVFFCDISYQVVQWFHYTPIIIAKKNEEFRRKPLVFIEKEMNIARRDMENDLALAQTEEEKHAIREAYEAEVFPFVRARAEESVKEVRIESEKGIREDMSAGTSLHNFLTHGPSDQPQDAGIYPALMGSLLISIITILVAVPIGVGAAIYLEEYKTGGRLGYLIQVNINNLAGVPSVVYGILGSFVFVQIFQEIHMHFPDVDARNLLGGGLTLALLALPIVIVSAQEAIRAVPSSIREGALALGATKWQTIWHQILPVARPGIFTGTILSVSRAIGEAAPLVLFGALLFDQSEPDLAQRFVSRFTVLPMQIFGWADRPADRITAGPEARGEHFAAQAATAVANMGFPNPQPYAAAAMAWYQGPVPTRSVEIWKYNAALGCVVLMVILLGLNAFAIVLRNRAQRRLRA